MKTLKKLAHVLGLFVLLAATTTLVRAQDYQNDYQDDGYSTGNISLQTFYDELSPYGTWIQDPQYGYVWRPDVDQSDFRPYYSNGRWAMTEYGNTWVSNYDWGWAPFHYGRWVINSYRQWIWLPDTVWGPAWVDWRSGGGYYGWAPMGPSISINLTFGRRYIVPEFCWNFIPQSNIYINVFPRYNYARNNVYIRNTTIINNTYVYNKRTYYGGPRIEDIRRATNRDVTVYRYAQSSRPGASRIGGREVSIYRPRPTREVDNRNAAPRKFQEGSAGFSRNGRNEGYVSRDQRGNNSNRSGSMNNDRSTFPSRGNNAERTNNSPNRNRDDVYNRNADGRMARGNANGAEQNNRRENTNDGRVDQGRLEQMRQQRNQSDRMSQDQQRVQRDVQSNQQRAQQAEQQRAQRDEQMQQQRAQQAEQQRAQRDEQMQQQRAQQAEQQRAQRNEQMQQQRAQQAEQQRAQRDEQMQQQRAQQAEQQRAQRNEQMQQQRAQQAEQQRAQRDEQMQQQRAQQAEQQRAQRNEQMQQQRAQQAEQQRAQRNEQMQQQRSQQAEQQRQQQQQRSSEGGRPSRGGRG